MRRIGLYVLVMLIAVPLAAVPGATTEVCVDQGDHTVQGLTYDGNYTVRTDYGNFTDNQTQAEYTCVGGLKSYAAHRTWGFETHDPDTRLDYIMTHVSVRPQMGEHLRIEMAVTLKDQADAQKINYTTEETLYHTTVHHETNHHFIMSELDCHTKDWWGAWDWLWNGYASFSETLQYPDEAHRLDSPFYENTGADDYTDNVNRALDGMTHHMGLLHGYLYAHDGGMALTHEVIDRQAVDNCAVDDALGRGIGYYDGALAAVPGAHDTFEAAFVDFALDLTQGTNLSWGPPNGTVRDWSVWLEPVVRTDWPNGKVSGTVAPWAFEPVDAPREGGYNLFVNSGGPLTTYLLVRDGQVWQRTPFQTGIAVPPGLHDDVVVVLLAPHGTAVDYSMVRA